MPDEIIPSRNERDLASEVLFTESIEAQNTEYPQYLGDKYVVESILRLAASECIEVMQEHHGDGDKIVSEVTKIANKRLRVFVYPDDSVSPVRGWNKPGGVDEHIAKWCGIDNSRPMGRITGMLYEMMSELLRVEAYAQQEGVRDEQWQFQADEIFSRYAYLLLGMTLGQIASLGEESE